jgi:predicted nucleic acid-binding protein
MNKVLLDTDVLIDHLRGHRHLGDEDAAISVISRAELFAGSEPQEKSVEALLEGCEEVAVDVSIARRAGRIKRRTGLKIADALIAATALEHNLPLLTRNLRHFERVANLVVRSPEDETKPKSDPRPESSKPSRGSVE